MHNLFYRYSQIGIFFSGPASRTHIYLINSKARFRKGTHPRRAFDSLFSSISSASLPGVLPFSASTATTPFLLLSMMVFLRPVLTPPSMPIISLRLRRGCHSIPLTRLTPLLTFLIRQAPSLRGRWRGLVGCSDLRWVISARTSEPLRGHWSVGACCVRGLRRRRRPVPGVVAVDVVCWALRLGEFGTGVRERKLWVFISSV